MSPALVDHRARSAIASPGNVNKGAPAVRNPRIVGGAHSDVAAPAITHPSDHHRTAEAAMDPVGSVRGGPAAGIPGERNPESVFSTLFPPPKAERPRYAPSPGLSKSRFSKVRRHFASPRVRPGPSPFPDMDDSAGAGCSTFAVAPTPAEEPSGTIGVEADRASVSGGLGRASTRRPGFAFGRLSSDQEGNTDASAHNSGFAFMSGGKGNSGGFHPAKSENASFAFAAGHSAFGSSIPSHSQGAKNSYFDERSAATLPGNVKGEGTPSSPGVFLFRSGSKEAVFSGGTASDSYGKSATAELPEEMHRLNIRGSGNAGSSREGKGALGSSSSADGRVFVFGTDRNAYSASGETDVRTSTFFQSVSKESSLPDVSSKSSDKIPVGKLPEEIQKLNINDSITKNHSTDTENVSWNPTASGTCSSGIKTIPIPSIFGFTGLGKTGHSDLDASVTSRLPDGTKKSNVEPEPPNRVDDHQETFIFGSNQSSHFYHKNKLRNELKIDKNEEVMRHPWESWNQGVFVSKSDSDATARLTEQIQKLKVGGSVSTENVTKPGGENDNLNNPGTFVFSSSKSVPSSFRESKPTAGIFVFGSSSERNSAPGFNVSGFPVINSMLNESDASDSTSNRNIPGSLGETKPHASNFVFGSSLAQGAGSCKGSFDVFNQRTFNKLPEEMQKLNIRKSEDNNPLVNTKGGDAVATERPFIFTHETDSFASSGETKSTSGTFEFGSNSKSSTVHDHGSAGWFDKGNKLQAKMKELNIRAPMDSEHHEKNTTDGQKFMAHASGFFVSASDKSVPTSSDTQFSFNSTSQNSSLGAGNAFAASTVDHKRPELHPNVLSHASLFDSVPQASTCNPTFAGACEGLGTPQQKFGQNMTSNVKKGVFSHSRARKRRGKMRDPAMQSLKGGKGLTPVGTASQRTFEPDSSGSYSPMDFSPCQLDTSVAYEHSREASVASGESVELGSHDSSSDIHNVVSVDEDIVHASKCADTNEKCVKHEAHEDGTKYTGDCGISFNVASRCNNINGLGFTFAATTSTQGSFSVSRHRRKFRPKVGQDSYIPNMDANLQFPSSVAQFFSDASIPSHLDPSKAQTEVPPVTHCLKEKNIERNQMTETRQDDSPMPTASPAAQASEKWRLRGNQAYENGDLSKAEEYYTKGVNSIPPNETSRSCTHALMLCYSNRAVIRMSAGRIKEALSDCMMAIDINPGFIKAQLRAANCHLLLGEIEDASTYFKKCLVKGNEVSSDHKYIAEACEGLQKVKQVADYVERARALLHKKTVSESTSALQIISGALALCPHSDNVKEMKAEALLMLRRYDELIQFCDQTLETMELNSSSSTLVDKIEKKNSSSRSLLSYGRAWCYYNKCKAHFCSGRLDEALSLLQEEWVEGIDERCGTMSSSLTLLSVTVRELLRLKIAGNSAFKAGQHSEAVEHYTAALTYNIESRPFAAVCFCNRAAAYQTLGQVTDAISDCSLAIALDPIYPKALSRRATLFEMIRDYSQANKDLLRLVSLLEEKLGGQIGGRRTTGNGDDPELVHLRLAKVEDKARKEIPLDMYKILGIETSSDASEIKKAYRKAALRHHPDKAGQLLVRSENTDEGLWKEVADEVHKDADHLFKIIGEAYAVLSDPSKRLQYDTEEEIRNSKNAGGCGSTPRSQTDFHGSHFDRSNRWHSREWRTYGSSKWSGSHPNSRYF